MNIQIFGTGKCFDTKKAGFISLKWLPYFANLRRDGYDFDALWDDEKASYKSKKIMDCFEIKEQYPSASESQIKKIIGIKNWDDSEKEVKKLSNPKRSR